MKNGIWTKIIFVVVIPFLVIFSIISIFIILTVYGEKLDQAEQTIRNLALYNELSIKSFVENATLSVQRAAVEFEGIDTEEPNARNRGEDILISMLDDHAVVNTWLVFEPDAFDGRDEEYRGDYPGSYSGRYMRSFSRQGDMIVVAPDMDENTIDDAGKGYYYAIPKKSRSPYIDISENIDVFLWDYGIGGGKLNAFSVVSPIFRNGDFIGCVGKDVLLSSVILEEELVYGSLSMLLLPDGLIIHANDNAFLQKRVEEMGFKNADEILDALDEKRELFVVNENNIALGERSYDFFYPVILPRFNELLYVYATIPESIVMHGVRRIVLPIVGALILAIGIFAVLILFISRYISTPIHALTLASDEISQGNLNQEITVSDSNDEIGVLSRSLFRMVEQFRVHITLYEQSRELLDMHARLNSAAYKYSDTKEALSAILKIICRNYDITNAALIFMENDNAVVYSSRGENPWAEGSEFPFHQQILSLIRGKRYISLNSYSIKEAGVSFTGRYTVFLCILPIHAEENLAAYVIMESSEERGSFISDDTSLTFIQDVVSYVLAQRLKAPAPPEAGDTDSTGSHTTGTGTVTGTVVVENTAEQKSRANIFAAAEILQSEAMQQKSTPDGADGIDVVFKKAQSIPGLDTERGLHLLAGTQEQYIELLRFSARVFSDSINRMNVAIDSGDIHLFAVEVHGAKGALNNIGALSLGEEALKLEKAGKAGDVESCMQDYPYFRDRLVSFAEKLAGLEAVQNTGKESTAASVPDHVALEKVLLRVRAACEGFDSAKAQDLLTPLKNIDFGAETETAERIATIHARLEDLDYDEALRGIDSFINYLKGPPA